MKWTMEPSRGVDTAHSMPQLAGNVACRVISGPANRPELDAVADESHPCCGREAFRLEIAGRTVVLHAAGRVRRGIAGSACSLQSVDRVHTGAARQMLRRCRQLASHGQRRGGAIGRGILAGRGAMTGGICGRIHSRCNRGRPIPNTAVGATFAASRFATRGTTPTANAAFSRAYVPPGVRCEGVGDLHRGPGDQPSLPRGCAAALQRGRGDGVVRCGPTRRGDAHAASLSMHAWYSVCCAADAGCRSLCTRMAIWVHEAPPSA